MSGTKVCVFVGLVYILPTSLYYLGTTSILDPSVAMMDALWHIVEEGSAGALVGLMLARLGLRRPVREAAAA